MSGDDYLWDGSGAVDEEVARLEQALAPLRYAGAAPDPTHLAAPEPAPANAGRWRGGALALAAAALAAAALLALRPDPSVGFPVTTLEGPPVCDDDCTLRPGQWLETGEASRALVQVADIGVVELAPGSRLGLVATGPDEHRLSLPRGRMDAQVNAPPRLLVVETPSATAVDLGCAYSLEVDDAGVGRLEVRSGWVALEAGDHEVIVPSGYMALTRPGLGPGTPHRPGADEALIGALSRWDQGEAEALDAALAASTDTDGVTLWHLLDRAAGAPRERVLDRILTLHPELAEVDRATLLDLDEDGRLGLFDQLYLGP